MRLHWFPLIEHKRLDIDCLPTFLICLADIYNRNLHSGFVYLFISKIMVDFLFIYLFGFSSLAGILSTSRVLLLFLFLFNSFFLTKSTYLKEEKKQAFLCFCRRVEYAIVVRIGLFPIVNSFFIIFFLQLCE